MFDNINFPTHSLVSMTPMVNFHCSAERECLETAVMSTSAALLRGEGKCSALLTREGFFDFVISRSPCEESSTVALVCQHKIKMETVFNNNLSDVKVSPVNGFYRLQIFSSCGNGWFMVDNMCINIYECQHCDKGNIVARRQCVKHGGYLADRILKNKTTLYYYGTYLLNYKSTFYISFWDVIHQRNDALRVPFYTISYEDVKYSQHKLLALNHSTLCATHNLTLCQENKTLALRVTNIYFNYDNYKSRLDGSWSIIDTPVFQTADVPTYVLCEKLAINIQTLTNCSELYMTCDDGTCMHDSLVCDGSPHCLHGEDEANCEYICSDNKATCMSHCHHRDLCSCSPEYFQCSSGGCVPLQKLCDKIVHCIDASDEPPTCVYLRPEELGSPSISLDINNYINDLITKNTHIQQQCFQEDVHPVYYVDYNMYARQPVCPLSNRSHIRFLCSIYKTSAHRFTLDHLCVYDHDCDHEYLNHCANGFHLLKCEQAYCVGRFKCPASYCIPFDYICNKVCDCPLCEDESICRKLLCPGMVLLEQMEYGMRCSRNHIELQHSMNRRQVIRRKDLNITDHLPVYVYLERTEHFIDLIVAPELVAYCQIIHSSFNSSEIILLFRKMLSVRRLLLPCNNIQDVPASMFASMSQLILLDLSHNLIQHLPKFIFCPLQNLQYISLHHNLISYLYNDIFMYTPSVQVLLLESNSINPTVVTFDISLPLLYRFSSDIPRMCCAFETVQFCSPPFSLIISCSNMITSAVQMAIAWLIGLTTSFLNLACVALLAYFLFTANSQRIVIRVFSVNLSLAELVTSACLLSYSVINVIFQDVFGVIADQWRQSWQCLGLECLFSVSSQASLAFAVYLSVHFAIHIPSVSHRETSQNTVLLQVVCMWIVIILVCIPVQILEHMRNMDPFNYFCLPFTTSLSADPLILSIQIVMIIFDVLVVMICIVSYSYLLVFFTKQRRIKALKSVSKRKEKLQKSAIRMTVLILSTSFTWVPVLIV